MNNHTLRGTALAAALLFGLAGCDAFGTGLTTEDASLTVLLTDAASDYVGSAWVDIGAIELVPAGEEGGGSGIITLTDDGTDGYVNLLELQGEATSQLASLDIEAGTYSQLRLIVDSAEVELAEGYEFNDGSTRKKLFVPSGAQTGIKLNLTASGAEEENGGVRIASGETVLVLDFDVNQSFVIQGDPENPAGINDILFTPTIRVVVQDLAGSISGTVSAAADTINIEGLVVTAEPTSASTVEAYQSETATATTDANGVYTIYFLVPADYSVSVAPGSGFVADPASQAVTVGDAQDVTGIDFSIDEDSG